MVPMWGLIIIALLTAAIVVQVLVLYQGRKTRQQVERMMLLSRRIRDDAREYRDEARAAAMSIARDRAAATRELSRHPGPTPGDGEGR